MHEVWVRGKHTGKWFKTWGGSDFWAAVSIKALTVEDGYTAEIKSFFGGV